MTIKTIFVWPVWPYLFSSKEQLVRHMSTTTASGNLHVKNLPAKKPICQSVRLQVKNIELLFVSIDDMSPAQKLYTQNQDLPAFVQYFLSVL